MMKQKSINTVFKFISGIEIIGICIIILIALYFQLVLNELPCPLCLLQRLGLLGVAFGFLLNTHYHVRPSHYALSLISAVVTSFVSLRQIALHVTDPVGYGSSFLGFHMYTWVFILCCVIILYIAIVMSFPRQYMIYKDKARIEKISEARGKKTRLFTRCAFILFLVIIILNMFSTFSECGLTECPDNPTSYKLLK